MANTTAEILTIGDEILYGQILDTNSKWISEELDKIGVRVIRKTTVGDIEEDILEAFEQAEKKVDLVLITGGLGPTNDDLTKPLIAKHFNCEIKMNNEALAEVSEFFESKGRELTEVNRQQAALPVCCQMISNKIGTAPGMWFERNNKAFVSMPGVPHEMKKMMSEIVLPKVRNAFATDVIHHKLIKTIGIGESWLADKIKEWEDNLPNHIKLAYLPSLGQVKLRLTATGANKETLISEVEEQIEQLTPLAGKYIYGFDGDQIEQVVGDLLKSESKTLAIAESCSGGYLSHLITSVPGSSAYYRGSVIPYQNDLKTDQLNVDADVITNKGAVSEETIIQMANNVRTTFKSDIGVATSGIAGPGGGYPEKPVGTVWIAYADGHQTISKKLQLWKDREINIKASSTAVLNLIRTTLLESIELSD